MLTRKKKFAQELLSTFSTDLGEVALIPSRGGVFTVTVFYSPSPSPFTSTSTSTGEENGDVKETVIWDRKRDGGFPEVKTLKSLVRNIIDPNRDLGHTDRALRAGTQAQSGTGTESKAEEEKKECEDCR
ncbi:selenoprotein [Aspergillus sclerotialis]|uniref:Selenoprotein n=1 Tax=Aspergillus sclerotialis TaxID=2070753 RepID=A0A3A2ZDE9_9EURO|nr:selenoprotein [Aspergillus sclerotialis]